MRICLDYRPALREGTGVGTYVRNLVRALARAGSDLQLTAFTASWSDRPAPGAVPDGVTLRDRRIPVKLLDRLWHRWEWPPIERLAGPQDVAHSPSPMLLPARDARTVITVHDCYFLRHPDEVFGPVRRDYVPLARRAARRADAVAVPSATTAAEVEELLGVPGERLRVTPLGVDEAFLSRQQDSSIADRLLSEHALSGGYLLFVGRREPRKDLGTLLASLALLAGELPECRLMLVGPDAPGWRRTWKEAPEEARSRTRVVAHQRPEVLAALYRRAGVVVMPSRWEGFGLPALEAMAVGTPVVATRAGAMPEVLGDAALWAAPGDPDELARQCLRALTDAELAARLRDLGRETAARHGWDRTAELTLALYRELVGR